MTTRNAHVRFLRAGFGAALLSLTLFACGGTTGAGDADGSQTGGTASGGTDGSGTGGTASGGTASGGAASGGSATGGSGAGDSAGLDVCPGTALPGGFPPCRTNSDCTNGGFCMWEPPTSGAGLCGPCLPTITECGEGVECQEGYQCIQQPQDPCQCMGPSTLCIAPCTETGCGGGEACNEGSGLCYPANCEEDSYACPAETVCDPARVGGDLHGCVPASCDGEGYACNSDSVCDPDHATADVHGCRFKSCAEGLACGDNADCNPDGVGCVAVSCTTDDDCDCGVCMSGTCLNRPYVCVLIPG